MSETLFTKIIQHEIPASIVYEDNEIIAFKDINAQAPVHLLIVPKKVIPTLNDVLNEDFELIGKMFKVVQILVKENNLRDSGYRTIINCNEDGGQTVYHLHLHLLGGRQLKWPPG